MNEHGYEHLQAILERLKLTRVPECLDRLAEEAAKASWTYVEFLDRVLDVEVSARVERDVTMKTRLARFPFVKTLDQFDFSFQPALNEAQIRELATARFVAHGENLLLTSSARGRKNASRGQPWGRCHHARDQCRLFYGGRSGRSGATRCQS
jgi:DNA replication protein DnaC